MDDVNGSDKPIDPFEAAKRRAAEERAAKRLKQVRAAIEVRDVQRFRPDWSQEQAAAFLHRYATVIAAAMLKAGSDVVRRLAEDA